MWCENHAACQVQVTTEESSAGSLTSPRPQSRCWKPYVLLAFFLYNLNSSSDFFPLVTTGANGSLSWKQSSTKQASEKLEVLVSNGSSFAHVPGLKNFSTIFTVWLEGICFSDTKISLSGCKAWKHRDTIDTSQLDWYLQKSRTKVIAKPITNWFIHPAAKFSLF